MNHLLLEITNVRTIILLSLIAAILFCAANGNPVSAESPDEINMAYVLMGMKQNRDRLRTGVFRAYGVYSNLDQREGNVRADVDLYCAFDFSSGKVRFDRSQPMRILVPSEQAKKGKQFLTPTTRERKTKVIVTPGQIITTEEGRGSVDTFSADHKGAKRIGGRPFDVRCLGLYYFAGFDRGLPFEQVYQNIAKHKPGKVERDPDGKWTIVWEFPGPPVSRLTLWVDESQGFAPIRSETRYARKKGESLSWEEPRERSDVTWLLHEGVWVPKTFVIQSLKPGHTISYDLAFTWESVNQSISEEVFTKEGLGIKDRTIVVDHALGQPVITEVINDTMDHASYYPERKKSYFLLWITVVNAGAVVLFVIFKIYRRNAAKKQGSAASQVQ